MAYREETYSQPLVLLFSGLGTGSAAMRANALAVDFEVTRT
jgi:hypothetical protein